jgi:hypothetical protein
MEGGVCSRRALPVHTKSVLATHNYCRPQRGKKRRKNDGSKYLDMEAGEEEDSDDEDEGHRCHPP